MSERAAQRGAPLRAVGRLGHAWTALATEQRLAAGAALALWVSMLLPWYSEAVVISTRGGASRFATHALSAFGSFSFVEASVLLVSVGVMWMLFARAERRAFHLPGGDGLIVVLAGAWAAILVFYRMLDTPHTSPQGAHVVNSVGLKWGIFAALAAAIGLAYAGTRVRSAHRPEPTPAEDPTLAHAAARARSRRPPPPNGGTADEARTQPLAGPPNRTVTRDDAEQLSFDVPADAERDPFGER